MAIAPTVLSNWVPRPFVLNTKKCGRRAKFSGDNSVVERERPDEDYEGCIAYTANPLPLGQVWQTTILSTTRKWLGGLTVGVTTTVPDKVPHYLPLDDASNSDWYYSDNALYHNQTTVSFHLPSINDFKVGDKIELLLLPNGDLHLFLNEKESAKVATGLPDKSLFGAVDVRWSCTKIKSEILSDQEPSLPELRRLKIPEHVATVYKTFGILLLHDKTGSRVNSIKEECLGDTENIVTRILEEWLIGKGNPCTWQILIKTLRDCDFTVLADQIEESKI